MTSGYIIFACYSYWSGVYVSSESSLVLRTLGVPVAFTVVFYSGEWFLVVEREGECIQSSWVDVASCDKFHAGSDSQSNRHAHSEVFFDLICDAARATVQFSNIDLLLGCKSNCHCLNVATSSKFRNSCSA